jgi:hypothetical protein
MNRSSTAILLVAFLPMALFAQARPDFSGKWIDVRIVDGKDVIESSLVITQTAKELTSTGYASNGQLGHENHFVFGETTPQKAPAGAEGTALATWKGSTLVIVMTLKMQGQVRGVQEQTWSLNAAKNLVIESVRKPATGAPTTTKTIYRKA